MAVCSRWLGQAVFGHDRTTFGVRYVPKPLSSNDKSRPPNRGSPVNSKSGGAGGCTYVSYHTAHGGHCRSARDLPRRRYPARGREGAY